MIPRVASKPRGMGILACRFRWETPGVRLPPEFTLCQFSRRMENRCVHCK